MPSALAVGEQFAIDGMRFLRSVALGYNSGPHVTITLGKLQYMVETHRSTHAFSGSFGSAAAAACAAGLTAQQMRWVLSYTPQEAGGLASWQRDTDHIEKSFDFGGMPARNGVTAALLVQAGATGVDDILAGPDNFLAAFAPRNSADLLIEKLASATRSCGQTLRNGQSGLPSRRRWTRWRICSREIISTPIRSKELRCASPPTKPLL